METVSGTVSVRNRRAGGHKRKREYRNIKMKDWPEKWRNKLMKNMFRVEDSGGGYKEVQIGSVGN